MAVAASFLPGLLRSSPSLVPTVQGYIAQEPQMAAKTPALMDIVGPRTSTAIHALRTCVNCLL